MRKNSPKDINLKKEIGKIIPVQAWTGPEGFGNLRLPEFMTVGT
jgi:hypothetical protein